jgi:hypothetical protein
VPVGHTLVRDSACHVKPRERGLTRNKEV